ncbi:hypothetical protein MMC17_002139 [Xylographa soralifera]|nr:hypothetical protein [Xylographa soralifera]
MTYHNSGPSFATSVTLSTSKLHSIQWINGLDGVEDEELKELAFCCRTAMYALETELAERGSPQDDQRLDKIFCKSLLANAQAITKSGTLSEEQSQQLEGSQSFVELLNGNAVLDQHELKNARNFVWLIARWFGWPFGLLVICSLGKTKLRTMSDAHRIKILKYISKNRMLLYCNALHLMASKLHFYEPKHLANHLIDLEFDKRKRRRKEISRSSNPRVLQHLQGAPPPPEAPMLPPLHLDTPLPDAPAPLQPDDPRQPDAPQQHKQFSTYDPHRRFGDGLLSYTSSASSIDSISKSLTVVDAAFTNSFTENNGERSAKRLCNEARPIYLQTVLPYQLAALSHQPSSDYDPVLRAFTDPFLDASLPIAQQGRIEQEIISGLGTSTEEQVRDLRFNFSNVSHDKIQSLGSINNILLGGVMRYSQKKDEGQQFSSGVSISIPHALEAPYFRGSAGNPGPQLQLPTQIKVSDTAQSIRFAMEGDIDGLKYLFSRGLASPRDVSNSRGFSLIMWALYGGMRNYKTVKFLLSSGAFVDENSYQHAWDCAYRNRCNVTELAELRCITMNPPSKYEYSDWTEDQQFPLIHNIILGRSSKLLRTELDSNPDAVRVTDAMGRTALDWATARAQLSNMTLLIDRGSPLNTMDVSGRTTVLHAVDSHNDDALRILLEAGADPDPEVPKGLFRSSPLTAASFGGLVGMIKLLIKSGAKVDACNPEGRMALQAVASMQNVKCADILLTHGADLGYISSNIQSPLSTAIIYNSHAILKLFIDRFYTSRLKGFQLLPIIAEFADAETMSILASSDLLKQTLLNGNGDGFAAGCETLQSRTDYNKRLGNAFEDLCRQAERQCSGAVV